MLNDELQKIQETMCREIAEKYNLDFDELSRPYLTITKQKEEKVFICKKIKNRKVPLDEVRCCARVWNRGKGGQCSRCRSEGEKFCKQHIETRKHGLITEPPKRTLFPKKSRIIYK